ncbi:MAG: putative integron cassette protein, partial [Nevskia sp.]|nr:putative integron cassette protein [Nevskia sp.]
MKRPIPAPPPIIDSARTLCYAVCDHDVVFTDRIMLIVGSERLGEVSHLAICRNYRAPNDILLLFCDSNWESKGVIAFDSIEAAKAKAEIGYRGISK